MAEFATLAAGWQIFIGSTVIGGLEEFEFGMSHKDADMTTFESLGNEEHFVATIGRTLKLTGRYWEDPNNGVRNAGQEAVEALASVVGILSISEFHMISRGGFTKYFYASATLDNIGGPLTENTKWGATLKISGPVQSTAF
jgi:hypothetical protein